MRGGVPGEKKYRRLDPYMHEKKKKKKKFTTLQIDATVQPSRYAKSKLYDKTPGLLPLLSHRTGIASSAICSDRGRHSGSDAVGSRRTRRNSGIYFPGIQIDSRATIVGIDSRGRMAAQEHLYGVGHRRFRTRHRHDGAHKGRKRKPAGSPWEWERGMISYLRSIPSRPATDLAIPRPGRYPFFC